MTDDRCGICPACRRVEAARRSALRAANPPFSHADDHIVMVWNDMLKENPCERERRTEDRPRRHPATAG